MCPNCTFSVSGSMRFALQNNVCPSCGSGLFSAQDNSMINLLQARLSNERFASKLTEDLIYDLSMFVFNEIQSLTHHAPHVSHSSITEETSYVEEEELSEEEILRREVERELAEELEELSEETEEDKDSKVEKLKAMRARQMLANPNLGKVPSGKGGRSKTGPKVSRST